MLFRLPTTTIAVLAFTLGNNIFATGCLTPPAYQVPSGWRKIDADGKFSFYLPPDMRDIGRGSIENFHREYTNGRIHLSFDYHPFFHRAYENRAIAFGKDFQEIELQVDGKKAFVFVYQTKDWKNRRLHMAEFFVGDLPNDEVILAMTADSRSRQAIETAKTIFRTVKLPSSSGNK